MAHTRHITVHIGCMDRSHPSSGLLDVGCNTMVGRAFHDSACAIFDSDEREELKLLSEKLNLSDEDIGAIEELYKTKKK